MTKKIFLILFIFIVIFSVYPNQSKGTFNFINDAQNFRNVEPPENNAIINETMLKEVSDTIFNIFLIIGTIVAVVVAAILGIMYMTGSVEAQAKVKETLVPFIVGCIAIFGAFGIWRMVIMVGNATFK